MFPRKTNGEVVLQRCCWSFQHADGKADGSQLAVFVAALALLHLQHHRWSPWEPKPSSILNCDQTPTQDQQPALHIHRAATCSHTNTKTCKHRITLLRSAALQPGKTCSERESISVSEVKFSLHFKHEINH